MRARDRVRPNLGKSSIVDGSAGICAGMYTHEGGKQGDDREKRLPHRIVRSGKTGGRKRSS